LNYLDYVIIVFLLIGFILGFRDGLVRKLIGIIGLVLGLFLAYEFFNEVANILMPYLNNERQLALIVGWILIFLCTLVVFSIIKRLAHPLDKVNKFLNQMIGGIAGVLQIVFFISAILLLLNIFNIPSNEAKNGSIFYNRVYNILPNSIDYVLGADSDSMHWLEGIIKNNPESKLPTQDIEELLKND